jgi:hypothetical protein
MTSVDGLDFEIVECDTSTTGIDTPRSLNTTTSLLNIMADCQPKTLTATDIASSGICYFRVGPDEKEFIVHSALLDQKAPILGSTARHTSCTIGAVYWPEVSVDNFVSFWQWLYTGQYDDPVLRCANDSNTDARNTDVRNGECVSAYSIYGDQTRMDRKRTKALARRYKASESMLPREDSPPKLSPRPVGVLAEKPMEFTAVEHSGEPKSHKTNKKDETNEEGAPALVTDQSGILIHHASLYVLAHKYKIKSLMSHAYDKLDGCIVQRMRPADFQGSEFAALAKFCFDKATPSKLRSLVISHASINIRTLWRNSEAFRQLVDDSGGFSGALVGGLMSQWIEKLQNPANNPSRVKLDSGSDLGWGLLS